MRDPDPIDLVEMNHGEWFYSGSRAQEDEISARDEVEREFEPIRSGLPALPFTMPLPAKLRWWRSEPLPRYDGDPYNFYVFLGLMFGLYWFFDRIWPNL